MPPLPVSAMQWTGSLCRALRPRTRPIARSRDQGSSGPTPQQGPEAAWPRRPALPGSVAAAVAVASRLACILHDRRARLLHRLIVSPASAPIGAQQAPARTERVLDTRSGQRLCPVEQAHEFLGDAALANQLLGLFRGPRRLGSESLPATRHAGGPQHRAPDRLSLKLQTAGPAMPRAADGERSNMPSRPERQVPQMKAGQ